jgi:hypothetical protein
MNQSSRQTFARLERAQTATTAIVNSLSPQRSAGRELGERGSRSVLANGSCGAPPLPDPLLHFAEETGLLVVSGCARLKKHRLKNASPGHAVPKGLATIAQRFNAGFERQKIGSRAPDGIFPGVETPGYSQDVPPGQRSTAPSFSAGQGAIHAPYRRPCSENGFVNHKS